MINTNASTKIKVRAKNIVLGILVHVFVKIACF